MDTIIAAADRLWEAAATGVPCDPVRDLIAAGDEATAYAVQQHNIERLVRELGWTVSGRKIGLTSPAVQAQLGVDRPDFGALFAELGHSNGDAVPLATMLQPRAEAEVALVLGADVDSPEVTVAELADAVAHAVAALEIVDSRIAGWDITFVDTVADNASAGRYALGDDRVDITGRDLAAVTMSMSLNGEQRSTGTGAACLGGPLLSAHWLATTMAKLGTPLRAGDVVLTGALGPVVPVVSGDVVEAVIDGLGRVSVQFVAGDGEAP